VAKYKFITLVSPASSLQVCWADNRTKLVSVLYRTGILSCYTKMLCPSLVLIRNTHWCKYCHA